MININILGRIMVLAMLACIFPFAGYAKQVTKDNVTVDFTPLEDGTVTVNYAVNKSSDKIEIMTDGMSVAEILPDRRAQINKVAKYTVKYALNSTTKETFWAYTAPNVPKTVDEAPKKIDAGHEAHGKKTVSERKKENGVHAASSNAKGDYPSALERLNQDPFFCTEATVAYARLTDSLTQALSQSENKAKFLIDNDIEKFLIDSKNELKIKKDEIPAIAQEVVVSSKITDPSTQSMVLSSLIELLNNRYNQRETSYSKLLDAVNSITAENQNIQATGESIINYVIIGAIVIMLLTWAIIAISRKKRDAKLRSAVPAQCQPDTDNAAIIVRRRTTSILKKQSIDDVVDSPEYLLINSSDFTADSAVRNIYIKNTCIKDVYNMYAEDLRNSNNPKEDGCMVLGRWVHNEDTHMYDISLEAVVFPGDDAVFKEYELNFGGKIKLRIAEKLRKLRRETNLQYDLVCWIHSHPGLGVFFSNFDDNVQMQLKNPQHPNFLIAFVVDILTSDQEMGIFTFRKDGSMNSKGDVTKMYSLEDMYKWALESDTVSFNRDNYYNMLGSAKMKVPSCKGVGLNNNSIIDLTQIVVSPETGIVGWAVGSSFDDNGDKEFVVSGIMRTDEKPHGGVVGVLLNVTHMSLPTIQRMITTLNESISFVLVYSSRQNNVTLIPVIDGELITDEHFYGEESIDDLKIWTRRKR